MFDIFNSNNVVTHQGEKKSIDKIETIERVNTGYPGAANTIGLAFQQNTKSQGAEEQQQEDIV